MDSKTKRREALRAWRAANPEKVKAQQSRSNSVRRASPVKWARKLEQTRQSAKRHQSARRAYDKARNPIKVRARTLIRNRIYRGTLARQPCEICGNPATDAHHHDYSEPLNVRWLCRQHHKEEHHV